MDDETWLLISRDEEVKNMSNEKAFWKAWLEGKTDKDNSAKSPADETTKTTLETAASSSLNVSEKSPDQLEEGLRDLSWIDSGRAAVKKIKKRTQSIGEEIGNSVTHGAMALFMLGMLPYAAIRAFTHAPAGKDTLDAFGVSVFIISIFCMLLASTVYHSMKYGTPHKNVMNRIDHIMIYVAIAGTYTPICLSVIGGTLGTGLCIAQWAFVIAGALFKSLAFSKSIRSYVITVGIYLLMGWMIVLCLPALAGSNVQPPFVWLILAGGLCYTSGVVCFSMKFPFAHMVWHFLVDFGALCHFLAIVYYMR